MRAVVADDSVLFREGLVRVLQAAGIDVVAQVGDATELHDQLRRFVPDVVVVDIRMPPTHTTEGLDAARLIRAQHPGTGVLVLSHHLDPGYAMHLLADGATAVGYMLKDNVADVASFVESVRRVATGELVVDPGIVAQLLHRQRAHDPLDTLTDREHEVLALMAEGRSNKSLAAALYMSEKTVEAHVRRIFVKLDLAPGAQDHRRVLAVLAFLRAEPA